jgi:nicotinamidase-related amidase
MPGESRTALLVMDVQAGIIDRAPDQAAYLSAVAAAVDHAHAAHIRVIYVVVGFRPGAPEATAVFRERAGHLVDPRPIATPAEGDLVVVKRRVSAFTGSDLEVILRANDIRRLVLCGIATSGVVLSTVREASDRDYELTVLSDLCVDGDPEVHSVLTTKVFPRQAKVMTSTEWISAGA